MEKKAFNGRVPNVEQVQDAVEKTLVEFGHYQTAKAYILYREQRHKLRENERLILDVKDVVKGYIDNGDWRIRENANIDFSFSGLLWHGVGSIMAYYALNHVYPSEISQAHINGDLHLHNLSMSLCGYCAGWSLFQLLSEGFNGVFGKVESAPAKHLRPALGQIVNFIGTLQNEWAGAQAFSSLDTYFAPFIRKDNLTYDHLKQAMQEFVFNMNVTSRWGGQCPFSNISFDWKVPEDLQNREVMLGGKNLPETYSDYQHEMDMFNKAFIEVMIEGDAKKRVFTWPIPTYNLTKDFDWNDENADLLFQMTAKYGIPYFQNFINSDLKPSDVRAMCCHLNLDIQRTAKKTGALFGSGESTGSVGVVTINMPRIGFLAKDDSDYFERLDKLMYLAKSSLEIKRKVVSRNMEIGMLPFSKRYLGNLNNHFLTIGLIGMNESLLNFMKQDITTGQGKKFALKVLDFMRERIIEFQEETGHFYNLEATPGEGTSFKFAKKDKQLYPGIITSGGGAPFYTNSTMPPVGWTDDLHKSLTHQEELQSKYTGGTVFHVWLGESPDSDATKILVKKIANNFKMPYFTITPTFSVCQTHGYISGENFSCPQCGAKTEVYSRVVGYLRPVQMWNPGKQQEFKERAKFEAAKILA